jgi:hypothetical protein
MYAFQNKHCFLHENIPSGNSGIKRGIADFRGKVK